MVGARCPPDFRRLARPTLVRHLLALPLLQIIADADRSIAKMWGAPPGKAWSQGGRLPAATAHRSQRPTLRGFGRAFRQPAGHVRGASHCCSSGTQGACQKASLLAVMLRPLQHESCHLQHKVLPRPLQ